MYDDRDAHGAGEAGSAALWQCKMVVRRFRLERSHVSTTMQPYRVLHACPLVFEGGC